MLTKIQEDREAEEKETEKLKKKLPRLHLTIASDEEKEADYEILDRKYPIKEWKTECLRTKPQTDQGEHIEEINQNVVIRSNGQKRYFSTLMRVLSIFDREDLNAVYQLVMDIFQDEIPKGFDRVLWGDLMVMFNPDDEVKFWNSQLDWNIMSWKLHSSSGVLNSPCLCGEKLASPDNSSWRQNLFLIVLTQKATNLTIDERYDLNVALHMFARRIVIQRQVEDLQLGVESYQKKLNLTKPNTFRSNLRNRTTYTAYSDPKRVIYKDQNNKNKLMRADELHKFSDGTLNDVRIALYDIAKGIRMEYLPKRKWSRLDKRRARVMVQDISKHLYERRLMRNLEKFVGGREYGKDLRWLSLGIHSHDPARTRGIYPRDIPLDSVEVLRSWCSIEHQGSFLKGLDYRGFATRCRNIQGSWIFELSMLSTLGKESSRFVGFSVIKDRQRSPVSFWVLDGISSKNKEPGDLAAINTAISDEDQALLLFTSLPSYYNNFVETLLYGWDTLKLEDMLVTLNSRELQKMTEAKGDGGKGLYNHKKSQGFQKMTEAKGDGGRKQQTQVSDSGADGYDRADVNAVYGGRAKLDNAGAVEKRVLDQTFNRLQKLISQLEIHGESISQEDVNQKFLRSLSPEWNTHTIVWRNKPEIDTLSLDDLYNNLKIYEPEVKGTSSSSTNTQNVAFVSSNNTSCTNGIVNTALGATNASTQATAVNSTTIDNLRDAVICGFFASTEPIGLISLEVKFTTSTKRDTLQESAGLQETKKTRIGRTQEVDQAEEGPTNFALMAYSSTSSNSKVSTDSNCSSSCLENVKILKEQNEQLLKDLRTSKINAITYKIGNFVPLKPDLSFSCLEEFVNEPIVSKPTVKKPVTKTSKTKTSEAKTSKAKPRVVRKNNSALIIEDWVSNSEEEDNFSRMTYPSPKRNMVPKAVLMRSGLVSLTTARSVNTAQPRTTVNSARPMTNMVNTVSGKNVNTARPKAVVNAARPKAVLNVVKGNQVNAVKASACWVWKPKTKGNPQMDLHDQGVIDSRCSRHMTGNMSYLTDFEEIDGGYVAFRGNPKGGKITGRGTIKTGNLDFENVYFVRELKFNLFSVSQMCDKKNSVLFNDTECIVLSPNFKLTDESQVLLKVSRKNNMYSVDLKNIVPKGGLTCLFAKATSDESKLWHRRLGHINFKTMNKLIKGNLVRVNADDSKLMLLGKDLMLLGITYYCRVTTVGILTTAR
ncbi:ribonuclease H-like domain-containing protein [Tanacetum coccineum]